MTSKRPRLSIDIFSDALDRLDEALSFPQDGMVRDACIQRFEFTFEMAWKAIQSHARLEGMECYSPRDCLRTAFRLKLLRNQTAWMAMVEDRNRSSRAYQEQMAAAIYQSLPINARMLRKLLDKLRSKLNKTSSSR